MQPHKKQLVIIFFSILTLFLLGRYFFVHFSQTTTPSIPIETKPVIHTNNEHPTTVLKPSPPSPSVSKISPLSSPIGTKITITGKNFLVSDNTVKFGHGFIGNLSSGNNGTTINFSVPDRINSCMPKVFLCAGESFPVVSGKYEIQVINANGKSEVILFEVKKKS